MSTRQGGYSRDLGRTWSSPALDLPLAKPAVSEPEKVAERIKHILESGTLTNGPYVRQLEERAADYLGVRHCVAVSSCTAGLMLVLRVADLTGNVLMPSFTFAATAHAAAWNGLTPRFVDIDPETLTISPDAVRQSIGVQTSAILATHVYGTPCDIDSLETVAARNGLRLFFDAAHAFGTRYRGRRVGGRGDAEVFSLSPTKVVIAGEGGLIATNDDLIAERCRIGRDYGNPGDYDCRFVGLNARMSEVHAAIAIASLADLDERLQRRNELASKYHEAFSETEGITCLRVDDADTSTYKDLTVLVDPERFGADADALCDALSKVGIETRRYFWPPVHRMRAYRSVAADTERLLVTDQASQRVISLPLWVGMEDADVARVVDSIDRFGRTVRASRRASGAGGSSG